MQSTRLRVAGRGAGELERCKKMLNEQKSTSLRRRGREAGNRYGAGGRLFWRGEGGACWQTECFLRSKQAEGRQESGPGRIAGTRCGGQWHLSGRVVGDEEPAAAVVVVGAEWSSWAGRNVVALVKVRAEQWLASSEVLAAAAGRETLGGSVRLLVRHVRGRTMALTRAGGLEDRGRTHGGRVYKRREQGQRQAGGGLFAQAAVGMAEV